LILNAHASVRSEVFFGEQKLTVNTGYIRYTRQIRPKVEAVDN